MFRICREVKDNPQRYANIPFIAKMGDWSIKYSQTLSQLDATVILLAISTFASYATPLSHHFVGSDWRFCGLVHAVAFSAFPTFVFNYYFERSNNPNSRIDNKILHYEAQLENLKKCYYEKKSEKKPATDEKNLMISHLMNYKKFLRKNKPGSDLYKRVSLSLKGENEDKLAKSARAAQFNHFCIKLLKNNNDKKPDLYIWASLLDFELALKWYKQYPAPNLLAIFKSIYNTRLNADQAPTDPTTYSQFARLSNLPSESLEMNDFIPRPSLYQLISHNEHLTLDSLSKKIEAQKSDISNLTAHQPLLKMEAEKTINLFKNKLALLIAKENNSEQDELTKIYTSKFKLAQAKENWLEAQQSNISRSACYYPKRTFKYTLYGSWGLTALYFFWASETWLPLSSTNRIAVWLLNAVIQQQTYLMMNSKNYFHLK